MRSVFFNVFQNLIIVLYVFDQDTNTVIRISTIVGLGIEIWKVTKVQDVSFDFENKVFGLIPRLKLDDKKDYEDSGTKEFDRMAFRYLGMALFPLAFCYCIYSVIYNEHKGWYSFILGSMYGFLLTFGFIMMTPQVDFLILIQILIITLTLTLIISFRHSLLFNEASSRKLFLLVILITGDGILPNVQGVCEEVHLPLVHLKLPPPGLLGPGVLLLLLDQAQGDWAQT